MRERLATSSVISSLPGSREDIGLDLQNSTLRSFNLNRKAVGYEIMKQYAVALSVDLTQEKIREDGHHLIRVCGIFT
jgi:hypothetical protein